MPARYEPTPQEFQSFCAELTIRGFREITVSDERSRELRAAFAFRKRHCGGRETGFVYRKGEYVVVVWTTWIDHMQCVRADDAAWVLILEKERIVYSTHPIHRTRNFLQRLSLQARIARWRLLKRPVCPECGRSMRIKWGEGAKSRYWSCANSAAHKNHGNLNRGWDDDMNFPDEAVRFIKSERKRRERYRAKARSEGREPGVAMKKRIRAKNERF